MSYNVETTDVQFINRNFVNKVESGHVKEASAAASTFVRQKLREEGFLRTILPPQIITSADLDRQTTEAPTIICEKEPDSVAATMPFQARSRLRYFTGSKYPVTFTKIATDEFKKNKVELMTYKTDIRQVIQDNSVKDMQKQEDGNFLTMTDTIATANGNVQAISGGFSLTKLLDGIKFMVAKQVPVGTILLNQEMYAELLKTPATQWGNNLATDITRGVVTLDNAFGFKLKVTNKNDLVPTNTVYVFTTPEYLGQSYLLQDATVYLKSEADIISFTSYEYIGVGIGNVNGVLKLTF